MCGLHDEKAVSEILAPAPTHPLAEAPKQTEPPPGSAVDLGERVTVQVGNRRLALSDLDKVLYPADRFTKGEIVYAKRLAQQVASETPTLLSP
ncbi:hypothetical protein AB0878_06100 [Amycolatopsis sp. NPDC047767]|uniref:hypothetical protein n=1 Tax=Amycolatopsis sp. NPDC047767 TaxID=3156765 RepID=UPI003454C1DF